MLFVYYSKQITYTLSFSVHLMKTFNIITVAVSWFDEIFCGTNKVIFEKQVIIQTCINPDLQGKWFIFYTMATPSTKMRHVYFLKGNGINQLYFTYFRKEKPMVFLFAFCITNPFKIGVFSDWLELVPYPFF